MMTDETGKSRTNYALGVGGKDYYPQVDELVHASPQEFKALPGKLSKDWLKQAKSSITLFETLNTK